MPADSKPGDGDDGATIDDGVATSVADGEPTIFPDNGTVFDGDDSASVATLVVQAMRRLKFSLNVNFAIAVFFFSNSRNFGFGLRCSPTRWRYRKPYRVSPRLS